jgi:N-acetylglucosaminyl-diphospho-decaprenol L-rhamnosyltransferase
VAQSDVPPRECEVAAVVVTMHPESARAAIESVRAVAAGGDVAIVCVVNDPAATGTWTQDGVLHVGAGMNLGWAAGMHVGANAMSCRYLWAIQDDLVMGGSALEPLVEALEEDPGLGSVRPLRVDAQGVVQPRAQGWVVDDVGLPCGDVPARAMPAVQYSDPATGSFLLSSGQLIRREAWDAVGGFDPWFYPWGFVDVDFGRTLTETGWRFRSVPGATMTHPGGGSTTSALRMFSFARNRSLYLQKWADPPGDPLPVLPGIDPWIVEQVRGGRARPRQDDLAGLQHLVGVSATDVTRSMARWLPEEWQRHEEANGFRPSLLDRVAGWANRVRGDG